MKRNLSFFFFFFFFFLWFWFYDPFKIILLSSSRSLSEMGETRGTGEKPPDLDCLAADFYIVFVEQSGDNLYLIYSRLVEL